MLPLEREGRPYLLESVQRKIHDRYIFELKDGKPPSQRQLLKEYLPTYPDLTAWDIFLSVHREHWSKSGETMWHYLESDITVIGNGSVGEKARQLILKTPQLREIGFYTPPRIILAERSFDDFFGRNRLGTRLRDVDISQDTQDRVRRGSLSSHQFETLKEIVTFFGNNPLVIRSSAEKDARGTGTYKSVFTNPDLRDVRKSLQQVLASYFSESAVAFRGDAQTGEGFGIIIEPLIGQTHTHVTREDRFAPVLSGFGYTSTARGEGYVSVVPGIGGGVETRYGERITRQLLEQYGGLLQEYLRRERLAIAHGRKAAKDSSLLTGDRYGYTADAYVPPRHYRQKGEFSSTKIELTDETTQALEMLNMNRLFTMMDQMEKAFNTPQYFEWAMTFEGNQPVYWVVQVADANPRLDMMDFEHHGEVMFMAHTVTGTGIKDCTKIVGCWTLQDIDKLNEFNKINANYILIFLSDLTTFRKARRLQYGDFNNAAVLLEVQREHHAGDPIAHLGGQLEMTGNFLQ